MEDFEDILMLIARIGIVVLHGAEIIGTSLASAVVIFMAIEEVMELRRSTHDMKRNRLISKINQQFRKFYKKEQL